MPQEEKKGLSLKHGLGKQMWRFFWVGSAAFVVNAGIVELLVGEMGPAWAQVVAFPAAATVAWWLNRVYTFGASGRKISHEWLHYLVANSLGWLLNNGVYFAAVYMSPPAARHPSLAVAAGSLAGMVSNFILSRQMVFRRKPGP